MSDIAYKMEYLGGHAAYPGHFPITLCLRDHSFDIPEMKINITYTNISEVSNMDAEKLSAGRVLVLGVIGALWKKKERYLLIRYHDNIQSQSLILKGPGLEKIQHDLYSRYVSDKQPLTPP